MSDYNNTYTEGTGDTIDTTDFSTEFSAIESAVATKVDDGGTFTSGTVASGTINSSTVNGGTLHSHGSVDLTAYGSTDIDFGSIPSWVKKITISFADVSVATGNANLLVRLGDSGGLESSGYLDAYLIFNETLTDYSSSYTASDSEWFIIQASDPASIVTGTLILTLVGSNTWVLDSKAFQYEAGVGYDWILKSGAKTLTGTLDRVRFYSGSNNFDAGTIDLLYEG